MKGKQIRQYSKDQTPKKEGTAYENRSAEENHLSQRETLCKKIQFNKSHEKE